MVRLLIDCPDRISQIPVVIAHCFFGQTGQVKTRRTGLCLSVCRQQ